METPSFERLTNRYGLVPMRIIDPFFAPYQQNSIAGFPPEEGARLFRRGSAVPVDGEGREIDIDLPAAEPTVVAVDAKGLTPIPDGWETAHHLSRIRIARTLRGGDAPITADEADVIIRAELQRRGKE